MAVSSRRHRGADPRRVLVLLALFTYVSSSTALAQAERPFAVLAMHMVGPDSESAKANIVWTSALRNVLQSRLHRAVDVFQEFLPVDRLATQDASLALRDYLHERYRDQHIDVVISGTSAVLDFLLRFRDDLFPKTPIVSAGLRIADSVRDSGAGVALVEASGNFRETLALALRLHPAARQVYVIVGSPARVPQIRLDLVPIAGNVELTYIAEPSAPEMIQAVKHAPADSLILYIGYTQDVPGRQLSRLELAQLVAEASPVPVYGLYEADIGLGIVGGAVRRVEDEAVQLATLAARVLNGERAPDIPIQSVRLVPMFDWRQLRRWAIRESILPAGSDIRFRVPTVWEQYRWVIVGTVALLAFQTAMIVGLIVQRTRRREMAKALVASQERYALATVAGRVGVWDLDTETKSISVDPGFRTLLGYPQRDAREPLDDWLRFVHPEDRAFVVARIQEHIAGESRVYEIEHRVMHRDGTVHWVLVRGSIAETDGRQTKIVGTITDTTARKRAEQQLHEVQAELARIARLTALGEFAASIAHEVRQPLTAIISSARASVRFLSTGATAEAQEALSYVLDASKRADAVIERNRELFRNRTVQKELLECNTVIVEAAVMARPKLESSQVSLITSLADRLPTIEGDRIELQQVLLNLIVNAIDAMETVDPASRRLTISTALVPSGAVRVSVHDNGVGLGGVDMQRLFTLSYTTKATGTGVGLSISRSIIEAHGGRLWAEPGESGGATFCFTVPAAGTAATGEAIAI